MLGHMVSASAQKKGKAQPKMVNNNHDNTEFGEVAVNLNPQTSTKNREGPHAQISRQGTSRKIEATEEDKEVRDAANKIFIGAVLIIVGYLCLGTFIYVVFEDWTLVDALYFSTVTLTTVGYGDQEDWENDSIRIFTSLYALFGIMLIGTALGVVGSQVMEAQQQSMQKAKQLALNQANKGKSESTASTSIREKILPRSISKHLNFSPRVLKLLPGFFMLLVCILTGSVFIKVDSPELTAAQCFYFSVITVTTIGYGDISPQTVGGKVFGIFYVLFACATVAQVLGAIAGSYIEARQEEARMKVLRKQITMEDFQKFDIDGDGQIEKTEFVVRKLMLMGLINLDDVELCEKEFDVMDIDGSGEITMEDLQSYITKQTDVANLRDQFVL